MDVELEGVADVELDGVVVMEIGVEEAPVARSRNLCARMRELG